MTAAFDFPVVPDVYYEFRDHGQDAITTKAKINISDDEYSEPTLTDKEKIQAARIAILYYARFSASELVDKSHELPCWQNHEESKAQMVDEEIKNDFLKIIPDIGSFILKND